MWEFLLIFDSCQFMRTTSSRLGIWNSPPISLRLCTSHSGAFEDCSPKWAVTEVIFCRGVDDQFKSGGLVRNWSNLARAPRILLSLYENSWDNILAFLPSISWETWVMQFSLQSEFDLSLELLWLLSSSKLSWISANRPLFLVFLIVGETIIKVKVRITLFFQDPRSGR